MRGLHLEFIQKQPVGLLQKRVQEPTKLHIEWNRESDPRDLSYLTGKTYVQSTIIHAISYSCENCVGLFA